MSVVPLIARTPVIAHTPVPEVPLSPIAPSRSASGARRDLNLFLAMCWMLSVTGLTMPGRNAPLSIGALDPIALTKLATRGIAFAVFGALLLRYNYSQRSPVLLRRLFPLMLFTAWAVASVCWSPMQAVTIGHAGDLVVLTMLSIAAGYLAQGTEECKRIFCHLTVIAMIMSLLLILLNLGAIATGDRPKGYMQPNDMAKTAGAGLILITCCYLIWHWQWTRKILLLAVGIPAVLVFAARSRTASTLTPLVLLVICFCFRRSKTLVLVSIVCGLFALVLPYSAAVEHVPDSVQSYMMRGQTAEEMAQLSGRTEMWSIAWQSFLDAPIFGHGYYIMTSTGFFEVWGKLQWQTAHNAFLHVITGLGIMGTVFLFWALGAAMKPSAVAVFRKPRETGQGGIAGRLSAVPKIEFVALVMVTWYCAMGMFELSFFGPVDTSVVIFFVLLGISAGRPQLAAAEAA